MWSLPKALIDSLKGIEGFDEKAFKEAHEEGQQVTSIRINPAKRLIGNRQLAIDKMHYHPACPASAVERSEGQVPWTDYGYYLAERPSFTFDPLFHAGCYYVQEASSMFIEQAIRQHADLSVSIKLLDLCASPGGKSTHLQSLIPANSLLVSNETIRSRTNVLKDNIIKWGASNIVVTHNDPADFARLENYFDVMLVDAPCSGSGLFRREPDIIEDWSPANVNLCSQRQQRILADAWPALKKGGLLIYATCSYSPEEDEDIVQWLKSQFQAEYLALNVEKDWGIIDSANGFRFFPDKIKGEGFFMACFRKMEGEENVRPAKNKKNYSDKKSAQLSAGWIKENDFHFTRYENTVYAWPGALASDFQFLLDRLRVIYSGTLIGELAHDKLLPDHALAMSALVADGIRRNELDYDQAIAYLQKKDITMEKSDKGWQLVTYQEHSLGWVNVLSNRVNNYYPKSLRILKEMR